MAGFSFAPYTTTNTNYGKARPGAAALARYVDGRLPDINYFNIYRDDEARRPGGPSSHSDGRAIDFFMPGMKPHPVGDAIVNLLGPHGKVLGVEYMIYNRRIWSAKTPDGRDYERSDVDPHTNHVHVTLSRAAANDLTTSKIATILGEEDDMQLTDKVRVGTIEVVTVETALARAAYAYSATLDNRAGLAKLAADVAGIKASIGGVDVDEAALARELAPLVTPGILAALTEQGVVLTEDQITAASEAAVRNVLGSLDET